MRPASFLDTYIQYASEITDASHIYHKFVGLASLGLILGNRVFLPWGDTRIFSNIWLILLGESTWDRKTTSMNIGKRLIDRMRLNLIYPNEFSYESLIKLLSKRPCGGFYFSEFKTLTALLNKEYMAGARSLLADLYDAPYRYERELNKETYVIDNPAFSLQGATNLDWFLDGMKDSDFGSGFLARFLIIPSDGKEKDIPRPPKADEIKRDKLINQGRRLSDIKGAMYMIKEAGELHDEWYIWLRSRITGGRLDPFIGRLQGYLIKTAMLLQINEDQALKISKDTMTEAIDIVEWVYSKLISIDQDGLAISKEEKDAQKIKKYLRKKKDDDRSSLLRIVHLSASEFDRAIKLMRDRDEIQEYTKKVEGAKKAVKYYKLK